MSISRLAQICIYVLMLLFLFPFASMQLALGSGGNSMHSWLTLGLGWFVLIFSGWRIVTLSWIAPAASLRLVFYIFVYIWAGIMPLYQLAAGALPWRTVLPVEYYEQAYLVIVISIFSFELGAALARSPRRRTETASDGFALTNLTWFSMAAVVIAVVLGPLTTPTEFLLASREELAGFQGEGAQRLVRNALMRTPVYVALLALLWRYRTSGERRRHTAILLCMVAPAFLVVNFPTAVSRAWLGALVISIAVVMMLTSERRRWPYFGLGMIVAFLTVFPFMHRFRRADGGQQATIVDSVLQAYTRGDFDVFVMTAHFCAHVHELGIVYGRQLLGAVLFFVPRAMWPNKPVGSGYFVAEAGGFNFLNVSAPFWAEGLLNFGWAGVAMVMVALGWGLRRLEKVTLQVAKGSYSGLLFAFMAGYLVLLLRGDLMTVMVSLLPFVLSVIVLRVSRLPIRWGRN